MLKGYISGINYNARSYEATAEGGLIYSLSFEECSGKKFVSGDMIEFTAYHSAAYGNTVLNPTKTGNKYFEELSKMVGTSETIDAYVYEKKGFGFNVTYNGFNCFLPFTETCFANPKLKEYNNILNTFQRFSVVEIKSGFIVLSRKRYLKEELKKLRKEETGNLKTGFSFTGKVKSVAGFGIFITSKYSEGLLHVSKIVPYYTNDILKEEKEKLELILKSAFPSGMEINVTVEEIINDRYSLMWNKEDELNFATISKIEEGLKSHRLLPAVTLQFA
jgi:hypothetical protein